MNSRSRQTRRTFQLEQLGARLAPSGLSIGHAAAALHASAHVENHAAKKAEVEKTETPDVKGTETPETQSPETRGVETKDQGDK